MAYGTLQTDVINSSTGIFSTNNAYSGIAKAWLQYNGSTQTINGSFNVSSVTRNGAGNYTVNLTTAMSSANYAALGSCFFYTTYNSSGSDVLQTTGQTTTSFAIKTSATASGSAEDVAQISVAIFGA